MNDFKKRMIECGFSANGLARLLGCSPRTIRAWANADDTRHAPTAVKAQMRKAKKALVAIFKMKNESKTL